jgi:hypothetical protein
MKLTTSLASILALLLWLHGVHAQDWHYVVPSPGEPFANPPPRVLSLSDNKPDDLKETVKYRGKRQRYGQLQYGVGRTAAVPLVVDEIAPGEVELYVDARREREITSESRVAGKDLIWRVPLTAAIQDGEKIHEYPRTVLFRYGKTTRTLSVATCGYWEGKATLLGKTVTVRRMDGDANGLLADPQDRIWIDHNGDGKWDAANKEFLFAPLLHIGEQRIVVRADALGEKLSFALLEGAGQLRIQIPPTLKPEQIDEIQVTVQSRDGVVACLRNLKSEVTVPIGEYRVSSLLLTLKDPAGGLPWGFVFNDNGGKAYQWQSLAKGALLSFEPVGKLDFALTAGDDKSCEPGSMLFVRPTLYTGDGLLIERAFRGPYQTNPFDSGCHGRIVLLDSQEKVLDSALTGFA